jgi:hypothetical protein
MNGFTSANGKYSTTCKFCNKRIAEAPALDIPVIGDPGNRTRDLMKIMGKHLASKHPEQFQQGTAFLDEILSFLIFNAFTHEDPSVPARIERIRAEIFSQVRKNTFTDAMLEHVTATFGLDPQEAADVNQALRAVRDACCEFGQHAPAGNTSPAQSPPLIVPA